MKTANPKKPAKTKKRLTVGAVRRVLRRQIDAALVSLAGDSDAAIELGEFLVQEGMEIVHSEMPAPPVSLPISSNFPTPSSSGGGMVN